jgi:hypothetical protein
VQVVVDQADHEAKPGQGRRRCLGETPARDYGSHRRGDGAEIEAIMRDTWSIVRGEQIVRS